jgi:hypothetical protein
MKEVAMHFEGMFRAKPDSKLRLNDLDPAYKGEHESAETAKQETEHFRACRRRCGLAAS